ncbi:MAG: type II toxin-antitoxin system VapC family toxin [Chloracidobacterium sp.]|nr:type II toxin-antitoxin system VapC family toxin [Chloracidobacterium sp.]
MKYLLDTDSVSYALRSQGRVHERIRHAPPHDLAISSITLAELRLGAELKESSRIHRAIDQFIEPIKVLPFDANAAAEFGRLNSLLRKRGTPIGDFDVLIAAHAVSLRCTMVTNNVRHFSRIPGLTVENWT